MEKINWKAMIADLQSAKDYLQAKRKTITGLGAPITTMGVILDKLRLAEERDLELSDRLEAAYEAAVILEYKAKTPSDKKMADKLADRIEEVRLALGGKG